MAASKIVVLATGGTLAGTASSPADNVGYTAAQLGVEALLQGVPGLDRSRLVGEQVAQVDSKDMSFEVWRDLALRCAHWLAQPGVQGIVITHGTDTLEETAFFLARVLDANKPVVVTCAMRPATALMPDGPQNIRDAVTVASAPGASGVVAVCAGVVHAARDVAKRHTYRLDAFSSGDAGPVGYVEEGRVRLVREWPPVGLPSALLPKVGAATLWPRVEIVTSHAGADGRIVDALVAQGVQGIVVAATGNGTVHLGLEAALLRAVDGGVRVVRATRCPEGRVVSPANVSLPDAGDLSPVKARIDLVLELLA